MDDHLDASKPPQPPKAVAGEPAPPQAPAGERRPRKRRRGKGERPPAPDAARAPQRPTQPPEPRVPLADAVRQALATLQRSAIAMARARGLEGKLDAVELRVRIGKAARPEALAESFLHELSARLDEAQSEEDAVVANHAYCFRCDSFLCTHSRPADPREVLSGYEPTGRPIWTDFVSLLLDRRDERAQAVAERAGGIVAFVLDGPSLTRNRIEAFGGERPPVEILTEVVAGPFSVAGAEGREEQAALTVQFLAVRRPNHWRLVLHPISDPRLLGAAAAADDPDLAEILATCRSALRKRVRGAGRASEAPDPSVRALTSALANDLARDFAHRYHVRGRRTRHAVERAEIGVRPTAQAFPDARAASDSDFLVDVKTGTVVVLAKNSRVHFFNPEGKHVSSVRFTGEAIRARQETGRWRAAHPGELTLFRARLAAGERSAHNGKK
ncbi:MAG: hypothetical protein JNJ88_02435 [Planctomycetes bacterium]|nr:hypothetical protein [Planctomycetota bacterium]